MSNASNRIAAHILQAAVLPFLLLLPMVPRLAEAATPFVIEYGDPNVGTLAEVDVPLADLAPAFAPGAPGYLPVSDGTLFLYLDGSEGDPPPADSKCDETDTQSTCLSATDWIERTLLDLLRYKPFQDDLQALIDGIVDPGPQEVCFYTAINFGGTEWCTSSDQSSLAATYRSVRVPEGMVVKLWQNANYTGNSLRIRQDTADLTGIGFTPSSVQVSYQGVPLLDESIELPLIGAFKLGFFIKDLWGNSSSLLTGPRTLTDPTLYVAQKFKDDDDKAIDLQEVLPQLLADPSRISLRFTGAPDAAQGGADLGATQAFDGSIELDVQLLQGNEFLDADVIFKQPVVPANDYDGFYMHGGGKLRLQNLRLTVRVYTTAGNLRRIRFGRNLGEAGGTTIGIGLGYLRLSGSLVLDLDAIDCWDSSHPDLEFCDAAALATTHPNVNDQVGYEKETNSLASLLGDSIRYLEAHLVYEAQRTTGSAADYLTTLGLIDLRDLTHTKLPDGNYLPVTMAHPVIPNEKLFLDYSMMWRFNAQEDNVVNGALVLPGGFNVEITTDPPGYCTLNNPKPAAAGAASVNKPTAPVERVEVARANVPANGLTGRPAMLGFGIHMNPLNDALERIFDGHGLCMHLDPNTELFGSFISDLMNTDNFSFLWPLMPDNLVGRAMQVRMIPRWVSVKDAAQADAVFDPAKDEPQVRYCDPSYPCSPSPGALTEGGGPYDLELKLPHIELQFAVDDPGVGDYVPFFSVEVTVSAWVGLGVYKVTPALFPELQGSHFCAGVNSPCRAIRASVAVSSEVSHIYEYIGGITPSINPQQFRQGISQILHLLLNGALQVDLDVVTNLASDSVLGFTIDPVTSGVADPYWVVGSGLEAVDLTDDGDSSPNYLGLYLRVGDLYGGYNEYGTATVGSDGYADTLQPRFIHELLRSTGIFAVDRSQLGLAPALTQIEPVATAPPHLDPVAYVALPDLGIHGETALMLDKQQSARAKLGEPGAVIELDALTESGLHRYEYRIDGGFYQYLYGSKLTLPLLLDGRHTLEVWAVDNSGYLSSRPARLEFVVDRTPPSIIWRGDPDLLGAGGRVELGVDIRDVATDRTAIRVDWRLDDGPWQELGPDGLISAKVDAGFHTLEVRAVDDLGNARTRSLEFRATSGGGCAVGGGGSPSASFALALLWPVFFLLRRRVARG